MRRAIYILGFLILAPGAVVLIYLFIVRESQPVIHCFAQDDNIRPRTRCLLNPFRDKTAEHKAEEILYKLRYGQTQVLVPFFQHLERENMDHLLENESKHRIESWRIGEWVVDGTKVSLMYWVTREDYRGIEEEVRFELVRASGEWEIVSYSAIY